MITALVARYVKAQILVECVVPIVLHNKAVPILRRRAGVVPEGSEKTVNNEERQ